jgi:hypothetical protein
LPSGLDTAFQSSKPEQLSASLGRAAIFPGFQPGV